MDEACLRINLMAYRLNNLWGSGAIIESFRGGQDGITPTNFMGGQGVNAWSYVQTYHLL